MVVISLAFAFGDGFTGGGKGFTLLYCFAWCKSQKKKQKTKKRLDCEERVPFETLWPLRGLFLMLSPLLFFFFFAAPLLPVQDQYVQRVNVLLHIPIQHLFSFLFLDCITYPLHYNEFICPPLVVFQPNKGSVYIFF